MRKIDSIPAATDFLKENAERWAGLGDIKNYRKHATGADEVLISYEPPNPLTPAQEKRFVENATSLQEYSVIAWATRSLEVNKLDNAVSLEERDRVRQDSGQRHHSCGTKPRSTALGADNHLGGRCGRHSLRAKRFLVTAPAFANFSDST